jgi:hypothetical protein
MLSFRNSSAGAQLAAATLLGAVLFAHPAFGTAADLVQTAAKGKVAHGSDVETRIKTLHSELHITPEQEPAWATVAQAMRDNVKTMSAVRSEEVAGEKSASAPDMITGYGKTMDAHADAIHKFAAVFQPLYDSMSEAQKKTADGVFRNRVRAAKARHES